MKMGRFTEAREEIQRAIAMTQNLREQELLTERLKQIQKASMSTARRDIPFARADGVARLLHSHGEIVQLAIQLQRHEAERVLMV